MRRRGRSRIFHAFETRGLFVRDLAMMVYRGLLRLLIMYPEQPPAWRARRGWWTALSDTADMGPGARGDGSVHGQTTKLTPGILRHFTFRTCAGVRGGGRASHRPKGGDSKDSHLVRPAANSQVKSTHSPYRVAGGKRNFKVLGALCLTFAHLARTLQIRNVRHGIHHCYWPDADASSAAHAGTRSSLPGGCAPVKAEAES